MFSVLVVWSALKSVSRIACNIEFPISENNWIVFSFPRCLITFKPMSGSLSLRCGYGLNIQHVARSWISLRNTFLQFESCVGGREIKPIIRWNVCRPKADTLSIRSIRKIDHMLFIIFRSICEEELITNDRFPLWNGAIADCTIHNIFPASEKWSYRL